MGSSIYVMEKKEREGEGESDTFALKDVLLCGPDHEHNNSPTLLRTGTSSVPAPRKYALPLSTHEKALLVLLLCP